MFAAHPLPSFALDAAEISYVAAAVGFTVGVDDREIEPYSGRLFALFIKGIRGEK
jgi:hypothetical protein